MKTLMVIENIVFVSSSEEIMKFLFQNECCLFFFSICLRFKFSDKYIDLVESASLDFG